MYREVAGSIPSWGTCKRQLVGVSLSHQCFLPFSLRIRKNCPLPKAVKVAELWPNSLLAEQHSRWLPRQPLGDGSRREAPSERHQ